MTTQPTPGPWQVYLTRPQHCGTVYGIKDAYRHIADENGIRTWPYPEALKVDDANLFLIQAAPDLLALARAIVGEPGEFDDAADWKDARWRLLEMAETIIAKVERWPDE